MEVRRIAEQHAPDRHRRRRGCERRDGDSGLESLDQLLQHEHGARHRRVERGREPGPRACREQLPAIRPAAAEDLSDEVGDACPHLHARTLATEGEPRADREEPADELDRYEAKRRLRNLSGQDGLHLRNATPRCVGCIPSDHPGGDRDRAGARRRDEQQTGGHRFPACALRSAPHARGRPGRAPSGSRLPRVPRPRRRPEPRMRA